MMLLRGSRIGACRLRMGDGVSCPLPLSCSPCTRHRFGRCGLTTVELIVALVIGAVLAAGSIGLLQRLVHAFAYVPSESRAAQVGAELLDAVAEGSVTTIAGAPSTRLRGFRFGRRAGAATPTFQLAESGRAWFTTHGECEASTATCLVQLRLDAPTGTLRRSYDLPAAGVAFSAEEALPYHAGGEVVAQGAGPAGQLFRYYNAAGTELIPPISAANRATIRMVEIHATIQTGSGDIDQGEGRLTLRSLVAIQYP